MVVVVFVTMQTGHHVVPQGHDVIGDVVCYGVIIEAFDMFVVYVNAA